MPKSRSRSYNARITFIGSYTDSPSGAMQYQQANIGNWGAMDDVTDPLRGANPMSSRKFQTSGGMITGHITSTTTGQVVRRFNNLPAGTHSSGPVSPIVSPGWVTNNGHLTWWATRIVAETNPQTADVNVPQNLGELKDVPKLLEQLGKYVSNAFLTGSPHKLLSDLFLMDRWALQPLLADLRKLLNLQRSLDRRLREINDMKDGKNLRKRVRLDKFKNTIYRDVPYNSVGVTLKAAETTTYDGTSWGSIEWYLPSWSPYRAMSDDELKTSAQLSSLGINSLSAFQALWELVPWSWLVDWFANVGDLLKAAHNSYWMTYRKLCIMKHTKCMITRVPYKHTSPGYGSVKASTYHGSSEYKERFVPGIVLPLPLFRMPILTNGQTSIVAALLASRSEMLWKVANPSWFNKRIWAPRPQRRK